MKYIVTSPLCLFSGNVKMFIKDRKTNIKLNQVILKHNDS